jgi:hypothetical protein
MPALDWPYIFPRLAAANVELLTQSRITDVTDRTVTLSSIWGSMPRRIDEIDAAVISLRKVPNDELYRSIRSLFRDVHVLGDALSPRSVREAVYEGEKLGRAL